MIPVHLKKIGCRRGFRFVGAKRGAGFVAGKVTGYRMLNTGQNGETIVHLSDPAVVAARVLAYNPTIVVMLAGVNDLLLSPQAVIIAAMDSWVAQVRAGLPLAKIGVVGIVCDGEQWVDSSPPIFFNDAKRYAVNAGYAATCAARGATYIDLTTPLVETWEPVFNAPAPGAVAAFTTDGVHPVCPGSTVFMGTWALPSFASVPASFQDLMLFTGDSLTQSRVWFNPHGGLLDRIEAGT